MAINQEYLRKALNTKDCQWKSIHQSNDSKLLNKQDSEDTLHELTLRLIEKIGNEIKRLTDLGAPEIILTVDIKKLEKAKRGVNPNFTPLKKRLKDLL